MEDQSVGVDLNKVEVRLAEITVKGVAHTNDDYVRKQFQEIFKAKTLVELFQETHQLKKRLESLGCFKSVEALIDAGQKPNDFVLKVNVEEKSPIGGSINTSIGNNEGSLNSSINFPNLFGKGERLSAEYVYGTRNHTDYRVNYSSPIDLDPSKHYLFKNKEFKGTHIISYEGTWRHLISSLDSPFEVREQSGHSLKSSFKYTNQIDRRDNRVLPKSGGFLKTSVEAAGFGGDVRFLKANTEYQYSKTFLEHITAQLSFSTGFVLPWKNDTVLINDKFFLGGPLNLRGFTNRGVGPHTDDCSLGNDAYWLAAAHVYTPLPFLHHLKLSSWLKTHSFLNIGNLFSLNHLRSLSGNHLQYLTSECRLSVGTGVVIGFGKMARLELNYAWPIWKSQTDRATKGLQFGIGINFN